MTASTDSQSATTKHSSRRALLAGVLGGIGAVAAGAVAKVSPVRAEGQNIQVGGEYYDAQSVTFLGNATTNANVLSADSAGAGIAIAGDSNLSVGVYGTSTSYVGVYGYNTAADRAAIVARSGGNSTGLLGYSGTASPPPVKPKTGVYGYANQDADSRGVWGYSGPGEGVRGATTTGIGLAGQANNKNGHALRTRGRVKHDKVSGVATIPAGSTGVTVVPGGVNVTSNSFVLLTPRTNLGGRDLWYVPHPAQDDFRIRISSSRSSNAKVAWLLLG